MRLPSLNRAVCALSRTVTGDGVPLGDNDVAPDEALDPDENPSYGPGNPDWERDFEKTRDDA